MLDFRRCADCGIHFPRHDESCPSCGLYGPGLSELLGGSRLPATGGLPVLAFVLAFFVPSPWNGMLVGAGMTPLLTALAWLLWKRRRREDACFAFRIREVEARLDELEHDLAETSRRLASAKEDLEIETRKRLARTLQQELRQDRRLQQSQRRLVLQLEQRLERLEIERFRTELTYFEACRDARVDSHELAEELRIRLEELESRRPEGAWEPILEEGRLLHRQLARGVSRLRAARRLDPLAHLELASELPNALPPTEEGDLDEQLDRQLERIERSFDAIDEIAAELVGDPDASGVRMRVDDDVMAALDEAELEAELERERVSVEGL